MKTFDREACFPHDICWGKTLHKLQMRKASEFQSSTTLLHLGCWNRGVIMQQMEQ